MPLEPPLPGAPLFAKGSGASSLGSVLKTVACSLKISSNFSDLNSGILRLISGSVIILCILIFRSKINLPSFTWAITVDNDNTTIVINKIILRIYFF